MDRVDSALSLASAGFHIFPLRDNDKRPRSEFGGWAGQATTDPAQICIWWKRWPKANIAIDCEMSCILVVDIDPDHGGDMGLLPLTEAERLTWTSATGGGGQHLIYRQPDDRPFGNANSLPSGIDTRGRGGYIVAPGSIHPNTGALYEWLEGHSPTDLDGLLPVPESLVPLLSSKKAEPPLPVEVETTHLTPTGDNPKYVESAFNDEIDKLKAAREGNRNNQLNRSAFALGQFVGAGALNQTEVESALSNAALSIGLEERESLKTIASGLTDGIAQPRQIPAPQHTHNGHKLRPLRTPPDGNQGGGAGPGEPPEEPPPFRPNYEVIDGKTVYWSKTKDGDIPVTVAYFHAAITEEVTRESGDKIFIVSGKTAAGRPFQVEIDSDILASDIKLKSALLGAAGAKAGVAANQSKHLQPSINEFTNPNVRHTQRFDRTGWAGNQFLIPGREPDGVTINLPDKLPYYTTSGNLDPARAALRALLHGAPLELSTVVLSFVLSGPIARAAGWRESDRYALFVAGQTGTFKTSFAQVAMALFGRRFMSDNCLLRFGQGATKNAMAGLASHSHDMPILFDNYKPNTALYAEADFYALLHAIVEGGEKLRLKRDSTFREARDIYSWPIFTGEDTPDRDTASLARLLRIEWHPGDLDQLKTAQDAAEAGVLEAAGAAWLKFCEGKKGQAVIKHHATRFQNLRHQWGDVLKRSNSKSQNRMRVASNLAINQLVLEIANDADSPLIEVFNYPVLAAHHRGLRAIAEGMATVTAASVEAERWLAVLAEITQPEEPPRTGHAQLRVGGNNPDEPGKPGTLCGWYNTDGFYLLPNICRAEVDRVLGRDGLGGVSNTKINQQLDEMGLIVQKGGNGRTPRQKKIDGKNQRVLHLKTIALLPDISD